MSQEFIASGKVKNFNIKKFLAHMGVTQYISFPSARYIWMLYVVTVKKVCTLTAARIYFLISFSLELYSDVQSLAILQ